MASYKCSTTFHASSGLLHLLYSTFQMRASYLIYPSTQYFIKLYSAVYMMQSSAIPPPSWFYSGECVTPSQAASKAGITNVVLNLTQLDFQKAFDFIKDKLSPELMQEYWLASVADASRGCHISGSNVSMCWFSIKFLDILWYLLFGRTAGPSPWYHLLEGLDMTKSNGTADNMLNVVALNQSIFQSPKNADVIIHRKLKKFFPMKIAMPESITPEPLTKHPKRPAADDLDQPQTETKRSSKDN